MKFQKKKIIFGSVAIGISALILAVTIAMHVKFDKVMTQLAVLPNNLTIDVMDNSISFDINSSLEEESYNIPQLTSEFPVKLSFQAERDGNDLEISVNGTQVKDGSIELQISPIAFDADPIQIDVKKRSTGMSKQIHLQTYPDDFPQLVTYGASPQKGKYYFVVDEYLVKLNEEGKITYYKKDAGVIDFKRTKTPSGKIRYSYAKANSSPRSIHDYRSIIIMDEQYHEIDELKYLQPSNRIPDNIAHDGHDFVYFDDGHYLFETYYSKRVTNIPEDVAQGDFASIVVATILQEVKDGQILWEWDSTDYPELYALSVESNGNDYTNATETEGDYVHFNSIDIDPEDGNYICSFRHLDSILKINSKTGEIIWMLGGKGDQFGLTEDQKFSHQHFARYTSSHTITLFDNANAGGYSRAMEFKLDEANKRLEWCKTYEPEHQQRLWMGSALRLSDTDDVFLIGWGGRGGDSSSNLLFSEVDFTNGKVLFEATCPTDNYRVYKFDE